MAVSLLKKISLSLLVLPLLVAAPVGAVRLNPDGLGQALIFPYYNAQIGEDGGAYNTMLSVVNYSGDAKAVRINIREGRQGRVVLSFNVFLMENDTWTAVIFPDESNDYNAKILTQDKTCTSPTAWDSSGVPFRNYDEGASVGNVGKNYREGYIEVIEMATIPLDTDLYRALERRDCVSVEINESRVKEGATGANTGGLSGHMTLINVQSGFGFNVKATALDDFAERGKPLGYAVSSPYLEENHIVDLTSAYPESVVPGTGDDLLLISQWEAGTADAVSTVLMRNGVGNEFVVSNSTASRTDWVMTFPTRYFYNDPIVSFIVSERDREGSYILCDGLPLLQPCGYVSNLSVGILSFRDSGLKDLLSSLNRIPDPLGGMRGSFPEGVMWIGWEENAGLKNKSKTIAVRSDGTVLKNQTRTYYGWPVIGFSAYTYTNAAIALPDGKVGRSIYGVTEPHVYVDKIE